MQGQLTTHRTNTQSLPRPLRHTHITIKRKPPSSQEPADPEGDVDEREAAVHADVEVPRSRVHPHLLVQGGDGQEDVNDVDEGEDGVEADEDVVLKMRRLFWEAGEEGRGGEGG